MSRDEFDRQAGLRNMMRECTTLTQMKSVIASAETIGEAQSLAGRVVDEQLSEQIIMHVNALAFSIKE